MLPNRKGYPCAAQRGKLEKVHGPQASGEKAPSHPSSRTGSKQLAMVAWESYPLSRYCKCKPVSYQSDGRGLYRISRVYSERISGEEVGKNRRGMKSPSRHQGQAQQVFHSRNFHNSSGTYIVWPPWRGRLQSNILAETDQSDGEFNGR